MTNFEPIEQYDSSEVDLDWDHNDDGEITYGIEDIVSFLIFQSLALILITQVVSRYIFDSPLGWTEEIARYLLVIVSFLGAAIGLRRNTHIAFRYFHRFLTSFSKSVTELVLALLNLLLLAFLFFTGIIIIPLISLHQLSSIDLSLSTLYGIICTALAVCFYRALTHAIHCTKTFLFNNQDE